MTPLHPENHRPPGWAFALRVLVKAGGLFLLLNLVFALLNPMPAIGGLSWYNGLFPGRERLPFGENAAQSYNLTPNQIETLFASHTLTRPKAKDEYRVVVLGDSSVWGILLRPEETLTAYLNAAGYQMEGRRVVAYNLGYPQQALSKDLLILDEAMRYQPDMIIWLVTLNAFPHAEQFAPPLVRHNPERMRRLINDFDLSLNSDDARFMERDFFGRTIVGGRRALADWLRLNLYAVPYVATGIDQHYPEAYTPRTRDFAENITWGGISAPRVLDETLLAFDLLAAGIERAGGIPVWVVNEPIYISDGENSDLRYNAWYPRWAYDAYREWLDGQARLHTLGNYLDLWDVIAPEEFTDSPVHLTPAGSSRLAGFIGEAIFEENSPASPR